MNHSYKNSDIEIIKNMEKRNYVRPLLNSEEFVPQTYVAACWSISCNVDWGIGYYERNNIPGYQSYSTDAHCGCNVNWWNKHNSSSDCPNWIERVDRDEYIAEGQGCNIKHTASGISAAGPQANAMWQTSSGVYFEVFHWEKQKNGSNSHHFSKVSDAQWEANPNAS